MSNPLDEMIKKQREADKIKLDAERAERDRIQAEKDSQRRSERETWEAVYNGKVYKALESVRDSINRVENIGAEILTLEQYSKRYKEKVHGPRCRHFLVMPYKDGGHVKIYTTEIGDNSENIGISLESPKSSTFHKGLNYALNEVPTTEKLADEITRGYLKLTSV
jgi:hypothetical protein